jgi:hypothetical protein
VDSLTSTSCQIALFSFKDVKSWSSSIRGLAKKKKLRGLSPRANYTDRRLLVKLVPTFTDRGCDVVSVTDPYGRIDAFLDRSRYYFSRVASQLYSRGWVYPGLVGKLTYFISLSFHSNYVFCRSWWSFRVLARKILSISLSVESNRIANTPCGEGRRIAYLFVSVHLSA